MPSKSEESNRGDRIIQTCPYLFESKSWKDWHLRPVLRAKLVFCEVRFMLAYVQNKHGKPLMPCGARKARRLLREGKAKVVSRIPFVIKLLHGSSGYVQKVTLKVDTGSKTVGVAAVRDDGVTLYASEAKTRSDVSDKMKTRASLRRNRRSRKTRYREARFDNRTRKDGWLTPTLTSKVQTHIREIEFVRRILPIRSESDIILEIASFDIHKITNPEVDNAGYQSGRQKDFYNVKAYVLSRDKHTCQKCSGKKKDAKLHVHHIVFRSNGGTNSPDNLITLCETCHDELHKCKTPEKESLKLSKKRQANTKDAVQVSTIGTYLTKKYPSAKIAYGYETKFNRESLGLPKAHFVDAMCVGLESGEVVTMPTHVFKKVSIARGDYPQTECQPNKKGIRPKLNRGKVMGFKRFDRVEYFGTICFVKGKMSTGYAILMDIDGQSLDFGHTAQFKLMKRAGARKTCLTNQVRIGNFTSNIISYLSANIEKVSLKKEKRVAA